LTASIKQCQIYRNDSWSIPEFDAIDRRLNMAKSKNTQIVPSSNAEVDTFLKQVAMATRPVASHTRGRLIFAMDATASREPMWDQACHIQSEMFSTAAEHGGLDVQMCFYRGFHQFFASKWVGSASALHRLMSSVKCIGGLTQVGRLLDHTLRETRKQRVNALVFVGDAIEENIDQLADKAGHLGLNGVPAFMFHEGYEPNTERAFREIAKLSNGAYCRFDASSGQQLKDLLSAVAVFASGGRKALEHFGRKRRGVVAQLTHQVKG